MRYEVINLFYIRHATVSNDIMAVIQNIRSIVSCCVITRLYL